VQAGDDGNARARGARLAGQQLIDGLRSDAGAAIEQSVLTGLQIDCDGDVTGVVRGPALDQLRSSMTTLGEASAQAKVAVAGLAATDMLVEACCV
jgi:hypothetical protein